MKTTKYSPKQDNTVSIMIVCFFSLLIVAAIIAVTPAIVTGLNLNILTSTLLGL